MEKIIDILNSPRSAHFRFFTQKDYPFFNITVPVNIAKTFLWAKERKVSVFRAILYVACRAAQNVPEFRRRLRKGNIVVEHDVVHPSFTVMARDEVFSFCTVDYKDDFASFCREVDEGVKKVREKPVVWDDPARDDLIFITSIPWLSFTSFVHPVDIKKYDSIPRIAWGKISGGDSSASSVSFPFSVHVHHGLMDGIHAAKYFELLETYFSNPEKTYGKI